MLVLTMVDDPLCSPKIALPSFYMLYTNCQRCHVGILVVGFGKDWGDELAHLPPKIELKLDD